MEELTPLGRKRKNILVKFLKENKYMDISLLILCMLGQEITRVIGVLMKYSIMIG